MIHPHVTFDCAQHHTSKVNYINTVIRIFEGAENECSQVQSNHMLDIPVTLLRVKQSD